MSEPVLVFCRQWPVTVTLDALLAPVYADGVLPLYTRESLCRALRDYPCSPLVLGLSPHEHVMELYRLQEWLHGRPVLFVARHFYWTDYRLPGFFGVEKVQFCTWRGLSDAATRRTVLRRFRKLAAEEILNGPQKEKGLSSGKLLGMVNTWLYEQMADRKLSLTERTILLLLADSQRGNLPARELSLYRVGGLRKLGMSKHIICLYRGVKIRPELQAELLSEKVKRKEAV
ncbi:hypothetical protein EOY42_26570 [Salmonella enterica]|nr:hypothetical protein [Salmonella enterica]EBD7602245.1 hypothetical protein [Salmonella enterica]EHJ8972301.1 hypothetical protein [Salmonella enterica]